MAKFNVKWESYCHRCQNPLNIGVSIYGEYENFLLDMGSYFTHKCINFIDNVRIYKTYGGKAYKMCVSCYTNKCITTKQLINYETSGKIHINKTNSKTREELYDIFKGLHEYRKRPDVRDCEVPRSKWPHNFDGLQEIDIFIEL